jgi:hypothetical protein
VAFGDIALRPRFWTPLILLIASTVVFLFALSQRVGWERMMRDALESNTRAQTLSAEQLNRLVEQQTKFTAVGAYAGAIAGTPVIIAVVAGVLMLSFRLAGGEPSYRQMFGITAYSFLPGLVSSLLALLVLHLKSPEDFDIQNPLAFNLAAILPEGTAKWLVSIGSSLDLFSLWIIVLLATGGAIACRGVTFRKALAAVLIPWFVWVAVRVGGSMLFG